MITRTRTDALLFGKVAVAVGLCGFGLSGCGSTGGRLADRSTPPTPVAITVYVNDARVSASPTSIGAGPALLVITNQASGSESLALRRQAGSPLASTAPINPQGTTQLSVELTRGTYTLSAGGGPSPAPVRLDVGAPRRGASNQLLQP